MQQNTSPIDPAQNVRQAVAEERAWRQHPWIEPAAGAEGGVMASRWQASGPGDCEHVAATPETCHVVKLALRGLDIRLALGGRVVQDGKLAAGAVHVTEPGTPVRCLFRSGFDVIHLFVPNALIAEIAEAAPGGRPDGFAVRHHAAHDAAIQPLARALLEASWLGNALGPVYADCIGTAIVARILGGMPSAGQQGSGLAPWRLRRAVDYIEANLDSSISLADMAVAAGLTRMHFAAQFKLSTGFRPHHYLLHRRVERAQEMLARRRNSLVDVALSVGFQSQSHFTTVFKRVTGHTPHVWRQAQHGDAMAAAA